ncbi:MAG TPA: MFS transporter [Stellaceae bacterium]|nr:MFS transporter [Stellaceae bacterium]
MRASAGAQSRLHYAWIVVAISFMTLLVTAGIRSAPGVLLVPLEHDFGWSRATLALPISIGLLLYGLVGPFSAGFIERFGLRAVMLTAVIMFDIGFGLTPLINAAWQLLLLWGVLVGCGTGMTAMVLGAIVAGRWFVAQRGLVMGLLTASSAAGQLIFMPLLAELSADTGWRHAIWFACALALVPLPLVILFMRDRPRDVGLRAYGEAGGALDPAPRSLRANPFALTLSALGRGVVSRDFWLLSASFFVCGASTIGLIGTHFIAACVDHGLAEASAAGLLAAMGVCNFIGTTLSGWLSDRFDSRHLLFWYYALRGLSLLFLPYAFDFSLWGLSLFGLFYGLDWIATVPPTVKLTANAFGAETVTHQLGSAAAAYGSGLVRTLFGDYVGAFIGAGLLCFAAALLVLRVGARSRGAAPPVLAPAGG